MFDPEDEIRFLLMNTSSMSDGPAVNKVSTTCGGSSSSGVVLMKTGEMDALYDPDDDENYEERMDVNEESFMETMMERPAGVLLELDSAGSLKREWLLSRVPHLPARPRTMTKPEILVSMKSQPHNSRFEQPRPSLIWRREMTSSRWMSLSCPSMMGDPAEKMEEQVSHAVRPVCLCLEDEEREDHHLVDEDDDDEAVDVVSDTLSISDDQQQHYNPTDDPLLLLEDDGEYPDYYGEHEENNVDFLFRRSYLETSVYSMFCSDSGTEELSDGRGHPDKFIPEAYSMSGYSQRSSTIESTSSDGDSHSTDYDGYIIPPLRPSGNPDMPPSRRPPPVTLMRRSPGIVGVSLLAQKTDAELDALMRSNTNPSGTAGRPNKSSSVLRRSLVPQHHTEDSWLRKDALLRMRYSTTADNSSTTFSPSARILANHSQASSLDPLEDDFDFPFMDDADTEDEVRKWWRRNRDSSLLRVRRADIDECTLDTWHDDSTSHKVENPSMLDSTPKKIKGTFSSFATSWTRQVLKIFSCLRA